MALLLYRSSETAPGGVLGFDVVTSETVVQSTTVTEFPVESGANISDHARTNLISITLEVVVSNTPITPWNNLTQKFDRGSMESVVLDLPSPPKQRNLITLLNAARDALFGAFKPSPKATLLIMDPFSATGDTYDLLTQLHNEHRLIDIVSRDWFHENMVISHLSAPRQTGDGSTMRLSIELKEIRIVETKQTTAPISTEPRGKGIVNSGKQGGKDGADKKKSMAKSLVDSVGGWLKS